MATAASSSADLLGRAVRLQVLTVAWMVVEAVAAIVSALVAQSPALLGFGGDSAIELVSAAVVLWRFRTRSDSAKAEKLAAHLAGVLLLALAAIVISSSALSLLGYREPRPTFVGIAILIAAGVGMPWLANQKRKLATQLSCVSLKADAAESQSAAIWLGLLWRDCSSTPSFMRRGPTRSLLLRSSPLL